MTHTVKSKFDGLLRGLLRHVDDEVSATPSKRPVTAVAPPPVLSTTAATRSPMHLPTAPNENELAVPLAPVIAGLPPELRAKIMAVPPPGLAINVPVETILTQLPFGAVKISFGELRQMAASVFANSSGEHDIKMVSLPLNEILPRLNPALLARRTAPKVEVGEEVKGPFGDRTAGVTFTTQPLKPAIPPPPVPRVDRPAVSVETPIPSAPIPFQLPPGMERTKPAAVNVPPPRSPVATAIPPVMPRPTPAPVQPISKISAASAPVPAPAVPRPVPAQPTIFAALWDLAENWPEELRNEICSSTLANESVPLAGDVVEASLKRGRMMMTWKQLRTLTKPSSPVSVNDQLELDLPLKVIAPLFFAAQKNLASAKKAVNVSAEIPNLFFGFPQATPEAPTAAPKPVDKKTSDSNFFVWGNEGETPKTEVIAAPQTDFQSRQAQPKDVVALALVLPGVAGVLVTLPDGLCVASEVPAEFNADTLAAFIPQIFERMNQSAKELRMGALNNVTFTVGNVPWRIFRVNSVFFAAFGRAGESLPSVELSRLAGLLDRKKQA
jgi:predicted regulator of Ras-like GTPase activity (Roadblock/LC7/MglB family)